MTDKMVFGLSYLRLSREEEQAGESESIANQRMIVSNFCKANNITLAGEFADDGWTGGNFDRPGFKSMLKKLEANPDITLVITKDLSRLGRDMRESSYYAEEFFPEHGVRYVAVYDHFDTDEETNTLAPFQFAMNEVYIRECSRKIKEVIRAKRANGQYCTCPPYGYKKDPANRYRLVPDEESAMVVRRIFAQAASGVSARQIAIQLTEEHISPPLKYRLEHTDTFTEAGINRATDCWNHTTVKRILQNCVYLGNTYLGKTQKVSFKSKKKKQIPRGQWSVTMNTHEPLVSQQTFEAAALNIGKATRDYKKYPQVRQSIFAGITKCAKCGHALCSAGTVYKGERDQYWYLSCTHARKGFKDQCSGVRIPYYDLIEVVKQDLNEMIAMSDQEIKEMTEKIMQSRGYQNRKEVLDERRKKLEARQSTIQKMLLKLYSDNAEGRLSDENLCTLSKQLEDETRNNAKLIAEIKESSAHDDEKKDRENFNYFFSLIRGMTNIDVLDRDTLLMFVDKIYVGDRIYDDPDQNRVPASRFTQSPYTQEIRIIYKFVGELK